MAAVVIALGSLTLSAICSSSAFALVSAYLIALGAFGASLVPAGLMLEGQERTAAAILHYARSVSPVAAMLSVLRPEPGDFDGRRHELLPLWKSFIPAAGLVAGFCLVILARQLARPRLSDVRSVKTNGTEGFFGRLIKPMGKVRSRRPIGWVNPILGKELRTNALGSARWTIRTLYAACFTSVLLALMALYGGVEHQDLLNHVVRVLVLFQFGVIVLLAPGLTSPAVSSEIESGTLELLRTTPLRAGQLFWGKLLPSLRPTLMAIAALVPAYAALCYVDLGYLPFLLRLLPIIVIAAVLCCVIGLLCSCFSNSTTRATAASYGVVATLFIAPALFWWLGEGSLSATKRAWIGMPSPLVMGAASMDRTAPFEFARLWSTHLALMAGCCAGVVIATHLALTRLMRRG